MTVGEKIKKIRQLRGLTQVQLADLVGLPVGRVKQYEINVRNPKPSQLEEFASALGVSIEFLTNHNTDTYNDIKHILLELEDTFGLKLLEIDGQTVISFNDREMIQFLNDWKNAKQGSNANSETLKQYELWKATYPAAVLDEWHKKIKEKRKELSEK